MMKSESLYRLLRIINIMLFIKFILKNTLCKIEPYKETHIDCNLATQNI
jgi:hypothetical protein